jgi:hypothetical protein
MFDAAFRRGVVSRLLTANPAKIKRARRATRYEFVWRGIRCASTKVLAVIREWPEAEVKGVDLG